MKYFNLLILLVLLSSCKKEINTTTDNDSIVNDSTKIKKEDISKINYLEFAIDNKAKGTLESWNAYNTISSAINNLKEGDLSFFKDQDEVFNTTLQELESTIPSKIGSEPIKARLLILKTKLLKFREATNLPTTTKQENLLVLKELFQSFSYVTLQINKKFEKEAQNIIKLDSL